MLTIRRTLLLLILLVAAPQIATAEKKSLEVTPLSLNCSHYVLDSAWFDSDVFSEPQMEHGVGCQLRIFVALDDSPKMDLAPESVRVNHFESPICVVNDNSPIGLTLVGNGVYTVDLPCEPEDMSLIFSDMSPPKKTDTIMIWARPDDSYSRVAMVAQKQDFAEELTYIRSLAETILGETLTISATTATTNSTVLDIRSVVLANNSILSSINAIANAIKSTVDAILDTLP